jgi:D-3-phosphoglycerate dehydrogenase
MAHILVAGRIHDKGMELLECRADSTIEVLEAPSQADVLSRIADADAVLVRSGLTAEAAAAGAQLRVVSVHGVGYDDVAVEALSALGVPVAVIGGVNATTVAEHTFFMMLALAKQCFAYDRAVREGRWAVRSSFAARDVLQKTLLIVGLGRIGREVAKRAAPFGMKVLAYDPYVDAATMGAHGAAKVDDLAAALGRADVVTLHAPRTEGTEGMIGAAELSAMRPEALKSGVIAGAGIDVFAPEPPPADDPLCGFDNVILSPHTAGLTEECGARMGLATAENALAGLDGGLDLELVVNPEVLGKG